MRVSLDRMCVCAYSTCAHGIQTSHPPWSIVADDHTGFHSVLFGVLDMGTVAKPAAYSIGLRKYDLKVDEDSKNT